MESQFKLGISRLFRASFNSCKSKHLPNDTQDPVFIHHHFQLLEPSSPHARSYPFNNQPVDADGRRCPPASPNSPLNSCVKLQVLENKEEEKLMKSTTKKKKSDKKKKNKKMKMKEALETMLSSTSSPDSPGFFSSDDEREEETETLVSSKSVSSDSSELHCYRCAHLRRTRRPRRRKIHIKNSDMGFEPLDVVPPNTKIVGKMQESVAVVKRSNDPYGDFRRSMVEMIIEKQMFRAEDLEELLQCFLSLNSAHHHRLIVDAFLEIWDALSTNWA